MMPSITPKAMAWACAHPQPTQAARGTTGKAFRRVKTASRAGFDDPIGWVCGLGTPFKLWGGGVID